MPFTLGDNSQMKKKISFQNYKQWYLIHTSSDKAFKGTVVTSPSLHGGSSENTFTVSLDKNIFRKMDY